MSIRKSLFRIWVTLTVVSVLVDAVCFWLVQHTPAALPGTNGYNYITILLVSAPAPIVLAMFLAILGLLVGALRWVWNAFPLAQSTALPNASARAPSQSMTASSVTTQ